MEFGPAGQTPLVINRPSNRRETRFSILDLFKSQIDACVKKGFLSEKRVGISWRIIISQKCQSNEQNLQNKTPLDQRSCKNIDATAARWTHYDSQHVPKCLFLWRLRGIYLFFLNVLKMIMLILVSIISKPVPVFSSFIELMFRNFFTSFHRS